MNYGLYISSAGLRAQQARQDVISNNLANASTIGFKRDLAMVQSRANAVNEDPTMRPYRVTPFDRQGGGVFINGGGVDLTQGMLQNSTNDSDLALDGNGFFTIGGEDAAAHGGKLLTRDGRFIINAEGELVTATGGRPVLDAGGEPIRLNPNLKIAVDHDGTISQAGAGGVKLGLVDVPDAQKLKKLGGNVMAATDTDAVAEVSPMTRVLQYKLEASSVEPMTEMVAMMTGQRAFDANARMISYQDQMMSQLNTVGRVA